MPTKFIGTKKCENWDREADWELKRRDKAAEKVTATETRRRERAEAAKWNRKIGKEQTRCEKVAATETRRRGRTEFLKWSKEMGKEEQRREKLHDLEEEKAWKGSKKFAQVRRRFRRKFERRKPPAFNVVKTYSNDNAKFTRYFGTYKIYVYSRVDPVAVFKKALDLTVEERQLVPGNKIRAIVSHPLWARPFSTKLITIMDDEQFFIFF